MEVGSERDWRWFPSGIESFCEDWAAQESVGEEFAGSPPVHGCSFDRGHSQGNRI